jgi:hypothetical protein
MPSVSPTPSIREGRRGSERRTLEAPLVREAPLARPMLMRLEYNRLG